MVSLKRIITVALLMLMVSNASFSYYGATLRNELTLIDKFARELRQENSSESNKITSFLERILKNSNCAVMINSDQYYAQITDDEVLAIGRILEAQDLSFEAKKGRLLQIMFEKYEVETKAKTERDKQEAKYMAERKKCAKQEKENVNKMRLHEYIRKGIAVVFTLGMSYAVWYDLQEMSKRRDKAEEHNKTLLALLSNISNSLATKNN